jgi:hypothetical protein
MSSPSPSSKLRPRQLRKGTNLEMVRLCCPDAAQVSLICESFGLATPDSAGIRDLHEQSLVDAAASLSEALSERAMQIHLQRIVGSYVSSAFGAGQFYSKAVSEAKDATARLANDLRDEDRDGPAGFDGKAQRKREFAADMGLQAHVLRLAAEGAAAAYAKLVGEAWRPYVRQVEATGHSIASKAAEVQMAALG